MGQQGSTQGGKQVANIFGKTKSITLQSQQKQGAKELKLNYQIDSSTHVLGSGAFGKVFKTYNKHNKEHIVAIKVMNKAKLNEHLDAIQEEIEILTKLDHPNIVRYYETYIDEKYIYLVMEYIGGGELFEKLTSQENQVFTEDMAAHYMKKLFSALNHIHAKGIIHRDIKPENIMITASDEIKIIDFGLSKRSKKGEKLHKVAGTPYYMAPEVLDGEYDNKCDVWSLGVLLYVLMSGYLPFQGANRGEVFSKIKKCKYHFNHEEFKICTPQVIDLIQKLLVTDPKKRLTSGQALQHPWFRDIEKKCQNHDHNAEKINKDVMMRLGQFKGVSVLKKAAMNMLVKMVDREKIKLLKQQFQEVDKDNTGEISAEELKQAIQQADLHLSSEQIEEIITQVDYFGNHKINYSEFLAATLDVKAFLNEDKLNAIFNQFDTDNSGTITRENIVTALTKMGHEITQEELDDAMQKHDIEKQGYITKDEFKALFLDTSDLSYARQFPLNANTPQIGETVGQ